MAIHKFVIVFQSSFNLKMYRESIDHPNFLTCSWLIRSPDYLISFGQVVKFFFNPITVTLFLEFSFLAVDFGNFSHKDEMLKEIKNLHNLIIPQMVDIVGFYCIFKQGRPTLRLCKDGSYKSISTLYGMPSSDCMYATSIFLLMIKKSKFFGLFILAAIFFMRIVLGYHNIVQAICGCLFGFFFVLLKTILKEEVFAIFNWSLALTLPLAVFFDKKSWKVNKNDIFNYQIWYVTDNSYLLFDMICCAPESLNTLPFIPKKDRSIVAIISVLACHLTGRYLCVKGKSLVPFK
ncbi:PAP2 superfamily protein [Tritrichomonas foetus]|uniref:PAP2 superfamily protein n=1 Tax=Tritrichomonas foetus TaxID=1144522 RepID=A0A1J4L2R3_9EUKA|nr:PAP2 superfamily protein [Tritrichomonas foetus]|eukprot:OHT17384.1 PAP2 superfamily protein [Tritrichomonas foetus]